MKLSTYIKREYGGGRGSLQQFANDIDRPYQSVQKWIEAGYEVKNGCVQKVKTIVVHEIKELES